MKYDPHTRWELCRRFPEGFVDFLPLWHFKDRERGPVRNFESLWEGQAELRDMMIAHPWLFALKAGKLGFSELACAWDGYSLLFRIPNARVQIISKTDDDSKQLLEYVKFGLGRLPREWGLYSPKRARAETTKSLIIKSTYVQPSTGRRWMAADDDRLVVSLPGTKNVAISDSAIHTHLDELSHMQDAEAIWGSVETTVSPDIGSMHIVTRGHGDGVYSAQLWKAAGEPGSNIARFFAPWWKRPRPEGYREQQAGQLTPLALAYYLPETAEDALMGEEVSPYISVELWDTLADPRFADGGEYDLQPGSRERGVLSLDAGVSGDCFAATITTRHPERHEDFAIRKVKLWRPQDFPGHRIDLNAVEDWVRYVCQGGCPIGHPRPWLTEDATKRGCHECQAGNFPVPGFSIAQICYDPYQLESMMARLRSNGVAWCDPFDQGRERLMGDAGMYRLAMGGRLAHNGDPDMREHIANCQAQIQKDEESKMRIIKKAPDRKVDLAVSASMGVHRCGYLML